MPPQLLWIMDIYGFMVAGFLVTMGTLGDRIGRRRLLLIGAATFGAASLLAAFARPRGELIAARAVLGIAGATLAPSTLSLIRNMFHDEKRASHRHRGVDGELLGRHGARPRGRRAAAAAFLVGLGVPGQRADDGAAAGAGPVVAAGVPQRPSEPLDLASALLSLVAVLSVVYGIKEIAAYGVSLHALGPIAAGVIVGLIFLRRQRALAHPFVDLKLFEGRAFRAALFVNLAGAFFIAGIYLFMAQYLQLVLGLTPLAAALWSLPSALAFILGSGVVPALAHRWNPRQLMTAGLVVAAAGFAMLLGVRAEGPLLLLVASLVVFSFGFTPVASLTTDLVVSSAPAERAGGAAALSETAFELGGALGIALLGSLGAAIFRARMANAMPRNWMQRPRRSPARRWAARWRWRRRIRWWPTPCLLRRMSRSLPAC